MRALFALFMTVAVAGQAATRPIKVDDFSRFEDVADPQVSPDGQWVLYTLTTTDAAKDRRNTDIWLVKWDGSERRQVTFGTENETSPRWSPDGRYISFLAARPGGKGKGSQVWILDRTGGEAHQLTELTGRISSFDWSPDATGWRSCTGTPIRAIPNRRAKADRRRRRSRSSSTSTSSSVMARAT